jgi:hypothetical protein
MMQNGRCVIQQACKGSSLKLNALFSILLLLYRIHCYFTMENSEVMFVGHVLHKRKEVRGWLQLYKLFNNRQ